MASPRSLNTEKKKIFRQKNTKILKISFFAARFLQHGLEKLGGGGGKLGGGGGEKLGGSWGGGGGWVNGGLVN